MQFFVFDAKPYLRTVVLKAGYHGLTVVFIYLTVSYALAAFPPAFARGRCEVRRGDILIRKGTYCADIAKNPHELDVCFEQRDVPELIDVITGGSIWRMPDAPDDAANTLQT